MEFDEPPSAEDTPPFGLWTGIASTAIGILVLLIFCGFFTYVLILVMSEETQSASQASILAAGTFLISIPCSIVGGSIGVLGLIPKDRRIALAILGIILNGCYLAAFLLLMIIGLTSA